MVRRTLESTFSHKAESNNAAFPGTISTSFQKVIYGLLVDGDSTLCFNSHSVFGKGAYWLQRTPGVHNDLSSTLKRAQSLEEKLQLWKQPSNMVSTAHCKRCSPNSTSWFPLSKKLHKDLNNWYGIIMPYYINQYKPNKKPVSKSLDVLFFLICKAFCFLQAPWEKGVTNSCQGIAGK